MYSYIRRSLVRGNNQPKIDYRKCSTNINQFEETISKIHNSYSMKLKRLNNDIENFRKETIPICFIDFSNSKYKCIRNLGYFSANISGSLLMYLLMRLYLLLLFSVFSVEYKTHLIEDIIL